MKAVTNRTFEEQVRRTCPGKMIEFIMTLSDLINKNVLNEEIEETLAEGQLAVQLLLVKAIQEDKMKIFYEIEIFKEEYDNDEYPYQLPSVDLCDHISIIKDNREGYAYMLAAGIIEEDNDDSEGSAWYPRFKTEDAAKKFVDDFHELYKWTTFWNSSFYDKADMPDHLIPCMQAIERYREYGSIVPDHKAIWLPESKYFHHPEVYVGDCIEAAKSISQSRSNDVFKVANNGVEYIWKRKVRGGWRYDGYRLMKKSEYSE